MMPITASAVAVRVPNDVQIRLTIQCRWLISAVILHNLMVLLVLIQIYKVPLPSYFQNFLRKQLPDQAVSSSLNLELRTHEWQTSTSSNPQKETTAEQEDSEVTNAEKSSSTYFENVDNEPIDDPMFEDFYHNFNCCTWYYDQIPVINETLLNSKHIPNFYLDEDLFNNDLLEECVRTNYSAHSWEARGFDPFYGIKTGEASFDYFLLQNLRTHPSRVYNLSEASFYFMGSSLSFYDVVFHDDGRCHPWNVTWRNEWMKTVGTALEKIKDMPIMMIMFVSMWGMKWPEAFPKVMKFYKYKILFAVPDEWGFVTKNVNADPRVKLFHLRIVPYKATSYLEDVPFNLHRNISFYFAGNMQRNQNGQLRWHIKYMNGSRSVVVDNDFSKEVREDSDGASMWDRHIQSSIQTSLENAQYMNNSQFCLIPVGDTSTSRRLFDAMAAGCIPVYMGPISKMYRNFPMTSQINWRSLVLFAGAFGCIDIFKLTKWLEEAPQSFPDEMLALARRNYETFHQKLSPFSPSFLDAFLRELGTYRVFKDIENFLH